MSGNKTDALGIDCGSYKTVLACVKQRGIEIVLSESSGKWSPTVAGYTDQERLVGDAALNQMKRNFKNTLQFFHRFMGLNQDCKEQLEEEKKFITYKVLDLENKKVGFEIVVRGEKMVFSPEQVMAFFLKRVKTYFEKAGMHSKEMVISVPNHATNSERQAYIDASEIAGIKCVRLINESTATALTYGFFRKADLNKDKARIVTFVDFGHSKLSVTFASFLPGKMKIIGSHSNKNLGARQIDFLLFDLISKDFEKKFGCDPRTSVKARLRLLDSIEKMRKLLTSNKEADVICESLMEDEDLHKHMTRDQLEELMGPFVVDFKKCLVDALEKSGLTNEQIDFVELVGEATRIPICIQQIKDVFQKEPSRTLNSTDCIARGCALQAAMLSPNFQVSNFQIEENNAEPISITYQFKGSEKHVTKELFKSGSSFPSTKSVTFENKLGGAQLLIHYSNGANLMNGLPTNIAQYEIPEGKKDDKSEKVSFTMRVSNNIHNIACLDEADICSEWTEEEKIPIKTAGTTAPTPPPKTEEKPAEGGEKPADGTEKPAEEAKAPTVEEPPKQPEQQYEIKKKQKKSYQKLQFSTSNHALSPNIRTQYFQAEEALTAGDFDILEMKELRNTLEAYSYEMRNNLDSYGSWEKYLDEPTRKQFLADINQVVDWLYGDGETAPKSEYVTKIASFKQIGDPVKQRHFYYSELDIYFEQHQKLQNDISAKISAKPDLTEMQKEQIEAKQVQYKSFMDGVQADRSAKQLYENPAFNLDQIIGSLEALKKETEAIFNLPPPKPKADEKMEDASKSAEKKDEEKKDVEMNNEEKEKPAETAA